LVVSSVFLFSACASKLPKLRQQLNDPDPDVKIAAIQALAEAKDTVSVPTIVGLLQDSLPDVRKEAAKGLGNIGDERACQPLADFYDKEKIEDVQDAGIRALLRLGACSVRPLIELLSSIRPTVRAGAARALGKLQSPHAVDPLIWLLRDRDPDVRMAAIIALREIGDNRGMNAIAAAVQDTDPDVAGAAEEALRVPGAVEPGEAFGAAIAVSMSHRAELTCRQRLVMQRRKTPGQPRAGRPVV
jgi:HEAT repeat protein